MQLTTYHRRVRPTTTCFDESLQFFRFPPENGPRSMFTEQFCHNRDSTSQIFCVQSCRTMKLQIRINNEPSFWRVGLRYEIKVEYDGGSNYNTALQKQTNRPTLEIIPQGYYKVKLNSANFSKFLEFFFDTLSIEVILTALRCLRALICRKKGLALKSCRIKSCTNARFETGRFC